MHIPTPLVSPSWLAENLGRVDIVDCRFDLLEPAEARVAYAAGHLPGATYLDLEADLSDMSRAPHAGRHPLPSREAFQASARRAGISGDRPVIAYDQAVAGGSARLWWLLTHFGHQQVAVLDGGLAAWSGELEVGAAPTREGDFTAGPGTRPTLRMDEIEAYVEQPGGVLLDARDTERYRGTTATGAGALDPKSGHIPGAKNLPFTQALREGTPTEVRDAERVAVYCGSGVTACVLLLALERDGHSDVMLYPGSWSEWSRHDHAVATGESV